MSFHSHRRRMLASAVILTVATAGCSRTPSPSSPPAAGPQQSFPAKVVSAQGTVTIRARPVAIVSLSPTATEDLFAVGAGSQVVAVDDQSNYPPGVPKTGLSGFKPNVEAIAARKPDLVFVADDSSALSATLGKLGIAVLVDPAAKTLDEVYAQISQIGTATGHGAAADALVASMRAAIGREVAAAPHRAPPLRIFHELDPTLYSATSATFIGQLYKLLGATDIADGADSHGSGYPQLSAEFVVKANPDVVFLADAQCCGQNRATVAARPGWASITAVRSGEIVSLDADVSSRWGPRVVDLVTVIERALTGAGRGP